MAHQYGSVTKTAPVPKMASGQRHKTSEVYRNSRLHKNLQTLAGVAGNALEWYDFAVFGYFSDVLGATFFPPNQPGNSQLIESFAVFGGAFIMRPVGGLLMGYLGDVYGRKTALEVSIFLMAVPTFCMGCLPTYERVGCWAYILLILVRLLQGMSVGGQLISSVVFTLESRPKKHWGLYGSYVMATANFGTLLGGVAGYTIRRTFDTEALYSYGWRIPFLSGILVSVCGLYLRYFCDEDESFHGYQSSNAPKNPLVLAFRRENRRQLFAACFIPTLWSGGFYLSFVWMAVFMAELIPVPLTTEAFAINGAALLLSVCLLFPIAGELSDRFGRRRVMTIGAATFGLCAPLLVVSIGRGSPALAFGAQSLLGVCLSMWGAPMMAWMVESFEPRARLTSAAVGYNIGQAFSGGLTPAMATYLVGRFGYLSPGFLLTGLAGIALFGLWVVAPPLPALVPPPQGRTEKSRLLHSVDSGETASLNSSFDGSDGV